jgi:hypothetical protein
MIGLNSPVVLLTTPLEGKSVFHFFGILLMSLSISVRGWFREKQADSTA